MSMREVAEYAAEGVAWVLFTAIVLGLIASIDVIIWY